MSCDDCKEKQTQTVFEDVSYVFQCDFCSKILKTATKFVLHQTTHTGEKLFHCKFCVQSFAKPKKLLKHQRTHVEDKPFQCRFCSESFKKPSKLIKHQISHTNEKAVQCRFCLKTLSDPATFVDHVTLHCNGREDISFSSDNVDTNELASEDVCLAILENSEENLDPSLEDIHLSPPTLEPIGSINCDAIPEESGINVDCLSENMQKNQLETQAVSDTTSECSISSEDVTSQNPKQVAESSVSSSSKDSNKASLSNSVNKGAKCSICDKEFASKNYLTLHAKIHNGNRPFKCMLCEKQFLNSINLIKHLKSHKKLICYFCDKTCTTPMSFFNHMKFHVQNTEMKCQFCTKTFSNSSVFRKHLLIHKTKETAKVNDKTSKVNGRKKQSLAASETNGKTLALSRKEEPSVQDTSSVKRTRPASQQCNQVNGYSKQDKPQNSKNRCLHCKRNFATSANLEKHMKLHLKMASFKCKSCKKNFASLASLKVHEKTHSRMPYICKFCKKTFHRVDHWQNHLKSSHGRKYFKCQFCNKMFDRLERLKLHQKYHLQKPRHSCPVCQKTFIYKGSLNSHIADHKK